MTQEEQLKLWNETKLELDRILQGKGKEYSGDSDRLSNFKEIGTELGESPEKVLYTYWAKHIRSVITFIKEGKTFSDETIDGRIHDVILYAFLLKCLIKDRESKK